MVLPAPASPAADLTPRLVEVAEHVHAYVQPDGGWCLSNAGVLVGPHDVTLVDTTATIPRARRLRAAVAGLTGAPVTTIVTTHHHGDHTFGNAVFDGARIIGHDRLAEEMRADGRLITEVWPHVDWGEVELRFPTRTVADHLTINVGALRADLLHHGPAHTTDDLVVWLPESRVLFTGDIVFSGGTPFVLAGSVAGSLAVLDRLRALDPARVVAGHGPVTGPEVFDETAAYLTWVQDLAAAGRAAGLTPLQVADGADLGRFAALREPERLVCNLHRAYAELDGAPPGAPLDVPAVLADMVTFHGGIPACRA